VRRAPTSAALASVALPLIVAGLLAACGDDDSGGPPAGDDVPSADPPADASLEVDVERVDAGVRIAWTVTNDDDVPLLLFDGLDGDEQPGGIVQDPYVTGGDGSGRGGDDGVAEVSRRLFPVPDDLEGVQEYGTNARELAPGASASQTESVTVPLAYAPAASEGGGHDLPDDPDEAVFCLGVGPVDELDASPPAESGGPWFVPHGDANMAHQTLLCSDPFAL
jgi:hypothetical protein